MPLTIAPGQTLADLDIAGRIVRSGRNVVFGAPPSARAGEAIVAALRAAGKSFVYLASVIPLADEKGEILGAAVYHAKAEGTGEDEIVTVPYHLERFAHQQRVLVWDCPSWLTTDYGFRPDQVVESMYFFHGNGFEQVIAIEDGPLQDSDPLRVQSSHFKRIPLLHEAPLTPLKWTPYRDLKTALLDSIMAEPNRPHLISLFNKNELKDKMVDFLQKLAVELGGRGAKVTVYNGDNGTRGEAMVK